MLDVRMELHDEVHECVPCGTGCRKCSADVGCKTCDWLYILQSNGTCEFASFRIVCGVLIMVLLCWGVCMLLPPDDDYEPRRHSSHYSSHHEPRRRKDIDARAEVVRDDHDEQVRRRSRVEPPATGAAAHSLRGYEGIDIIPTTGGGRDE
jgi:hypothetical protein